MTGQRVPIRASSWDELDRLVCELAAYGQVIDRLERVGWDDWIAYLEPDRGRRPAPVPCLHSQCGHLVKPPARFCPPHARGARNAGRDLGHTA